MRLIALISIIVSCVAAYVKINEPKSVKPIEDESVRVSANPANAAHPQQLHSNIDNLRFFDDGDTTIDLSRGVELLLRSDSLREEDAQSDIAHKVDEDGLLRIHGNARRSDGIVGISRRKRKAASVKKPHFRFETEKQLVENGFPNGFVALRRGVGSRGVRSVFNADVGTRLTRETGIDEIEEINRRRRADKILSLYDYIGC